MREVIEGMNLPYGKSCVDKLYMLRQEGFVPDHDFQNVLTEEMLNMFHKNVCSLAYSFPSASACSKKRRKFIIEPYSMHLTMDSMSTDRISNLKERSSRGIPLKKA
jgi:hypothetical protein